MRRVGGSLVVAAAAAFALAGCGGGGSAGSTPTTRAAALVRGSLTLTIRPPSPSATVRKPRYISAAAVSLAISVNGGTPTFADISNTSPICTHPEGPSVCTIPLQAPPGNDTFTFSQYDAMNGTGHLLGTATVPLSVTGPGFVVTAVLNGIIASLRLDLAPGPMAGVAGITSMRVLAFDPAGVIIGGPGSYNVPIMLSVTDPAGQTSLSATTITDPTGQDVVITYAGGLNVTATITATAAGSTPASTVFAPRRGNFYYVTDANADTLTAYPLNANGNATPIRTVTGSNTGLSYPRRIVLDNASNIYIANAGANPQSITVYAPRPNGNVAPIRTISGPNTLLTGVNGMAIDAQNKLYVIDCGPCALGSGPPAVLVFAPNANGNVTPTQVITGTNTGFNTLTDVTLDGLGNLVVSDFAANALYFFPTTANGNVAPSRTIAGSNTKIASPECIVTEDTGLLNVCNSATNAITVFDPAGTGNIAPILTLSGNLTQLNDPTSEVFDLPGNAYVANANGNSITVYQPGANTNLPPALTVSGPNTGLNVPIGVALSP